MVYNNNWKTEFSKDETEIAEKYFKMFKVCRYQGNANKIYFQISSYPHQIVLSYGYTIEGLIVKIVSIVIIFHFTLMKVQFKE